tara:strand:+ start:1747 stop:2676 length:930 start_codon:yes stop_codon:yes gene_type:complete
MKLSIVIPVYNEQQNMSILHKTLTAVLNKLPNQYEIIYVDDGSTDSTPKILTQIKASSKNTKVITFTRNFGQTPAFDAGFKEASGDIIITMDGDLQNDPRDIPLLLEKIKTFDVVSGWRYKRKDPFFTKKIPSLLSNYLVKLLSGVKIHDQGCSLKAYKKECIKDLELYGEMHRFIPLILQLKGYKIGEAKVSHHKRQFGKTKYNMKRLFKGFLDLAFIKFWFNFSNRPLHFFGTLGFGTMLLGIVIGIANIIFHLFVLKASALNVGPLMLLSVLLIILGIQFIVLGFLGEIMIRIYYKDKTPPYSIKK